MTQCLMEVIYTSFGCQAQTNQYLAMRHQYM
jgi:hypothetical protein